MLEKLKELRKACMNVLGEIAHTKEFSPEKYEQFKDNLEAVAFSVNQALSDVTDLVDCLKAQK